MGLIEDELEEVQKLCEHLISESKLISCVQSLVRVQIRKTEYINLVITVRFPQLYPASPLLIELGSKTLDSQLIAKVTSICEEEAKKYLGKPQILKVLKLLRQFIEENPLCCCYNEIQTLRKELQAGTDELKVRQKCLSIDIKLQQARYFLKAKVIVPEDYPLNFIGLQNVETNFPPTLERHLVCQASELARKCVEPPLRPRPNDPPHVPRPSLLPVARFLVQCVRTLPHDTCQMCNIQGFPDDPQKVEKNESADMYVERVYCGHLFHLQCLITYMKTPPFKGGKKCPSCNKQIFHDKWRVSERLAEARWAHQQARQRELQEVQEFFD